MKNSNDTIGNRTRDLPACSAVPQPSVEQHKRTNKCVSFILLSCFNRAFEYYDLNASKLIEKQISYELSVEVVPIYFNFFRVFQFRRIISARVIDLSMVIIPNNPVKRQKMDHFHPLCLHV